MHPLLFFILCFLFALPLQADVSNSASHNHWRPLVSPGGLTAQQVADLARRASHDAEAKRAATEAAKARELLATMAYTPRVSATLRYARASAITPPTFGQPGQQVTFPFVLNSYQILATATAPLSDYVFKIYREQQRARLATTAATHMEEAAIRKAAGDALLLYYQWIGTLGQQAALEAALATTKQRASNSASLRDLGRASQAEVLSADAQVAEQTLTLQRAKQAEHIARLRLAEAIDLPADEIVLGEAMGKALPTTSLNAQALVEASVRERPEFLSLEANKQSLLQARVAARAKHLPQFEAFGSALSARPNPRIFPQQERFDTTWELGLQLVWNFDTAFATIAEVDAISAQHRAAVAEMEALVDAVELEIRSAIEDMQTADQNILSAEAAYRSAVEAHRVRLELWQAGRGTQLEIADAESLLTRAEVTVVQAVVDQHSARVRLAYASGKPVEEAAGLAIVP